MKVLLVVWWLIKIIGILLGSIVGFLLIMGMIILFTPIHYEFGLEKMDSMLIQFKITWLHRLLQYKYTWRQNDQYQKQVYFLGRKKTESSSLPSRDGKKVSSVEKEKKNIERSQKETKETIQIKNNKKVEINHLSKNKDEEEISQEQEEIMKRENVLWKMIKQYPYKKELVKEVYSLIKDLLHAIFPNQYKVDWEFGLEDPANTGYILGLVSMISPFFGENVHIKGNFQKEVMKGSVKGEGKIQAGVLIKRILIFAWHPPVRTLIKMYLKQRKEGEENGK